MKRCGSLLGKSQVIFVVLAVIDLTAVFICKVLASAACTGCSLHPSVRPVPATAGRGPGGFCTFLLSSSGILASGQLMAPVPDSLLAHGPCIRFPALHRGPALSLSPAVDEVQETLHLEHDAWNCFLRLTRS